MKALDATGGATRMKIKYILNILNFYGKIKKRLIYFRYIFKSPG